MPVTHTVVVGNNSIRWLCAATSNLNYSERSTFDCNNFIFTVTAYRDPATVTPNTIPCPPRDIWHLGDFISFYCQFVAFHHDVWRENDISSFSQWVLNFKARCLKNALKKCFQHFQCHLTVQESVLNTVFRQNKETSLLLHHFTSQGVSAPWNIKK